MNLRGRNAITTLSAARIAASIFGVLAGLGGITHGIGEVLQGPVAPNGIWIYSWTQGPIATNMGGEPGITIVPNLLVTGILTIIISLFVIIWAAIHVPRKIGGRILILLSVLMLLAGGGVGPPIMGILAGVAGLGINAPPGLWRKRVPVSVRRFLAALWPWVLSMGVINGVFLVISSVILVYFFDLNDPDLFTNSFFLSIFFQLVMIFTGRAYDVQREGPHP
jgi:hypothetical protein